jgi:hypothetical protein
MFYKGEDYMSFQAQISNLQSNFHNMVEEDRKGREKGTFKGKAVVVINKILKKLGSNSKITIGGKINKDAALNAAKIIYSITFAELKAFNRHKGKHIFFTASDEQSVHDLYQFLENNVDKKTRKEIYEKYHKKLVGPPKKKHDTKGFKSTKPFLLFAGLILGVGYAIKAVSG